MKQIASIAVFAIVLAAAPSQAIVAFSPEGWAAEFPQAPADGVELEISLPDVRQAWIVRGDDGGHRYFVLMKDGNAWSMDAEQFGELLIDQTADRPWWKMMLNVDNPVGIAWVVLGLAGQVLFTGRMLVQWLASEKRKRSVVPVAFWWMSLIGASMVLVYFIWRRDPVGIIGQATGWLIYVRNLYFIYRRPQPQPPTATN